MQVQFEFTLEDLIDVSQRSVARSRTVRSWRMKGLLQTIAFSWGLVFLFFILLHEPLKGAIAGLFAAALSAAYYRGSHRRTAEKRLRELYREQLGEAGPFLCEVEITPVGIWVRQMNTQITHEWESVERLEETPGSVDIITRVGGSLVVRDRAFSSAEERRKFIDLAVGYMELARADRSNIEPLLPPG